MLEGQAKTDFEAYLIEQDYAEEHTNGIYINDKINFYNLDLLFQYSCIEDWFSSVQIHIQIFMEDGSSSDFGYYCWVNSKLLQTVSSKQEARSLALKNATEIYNTRYNG